MIDERQLRDCQAWKTDNLELSTTSNEAAKIFDVALHQFVGWYENDNYGGLVGTLERLRKADPDFVLGKVFVYGGQLFGTGQSIKKDKELAANMEALKQESNNDKLPKRERLHVQALDMWAHGRMQDAATIWERILLDHPLDLLALNMAYYTYFYNGKFPRLRDVVARVIPEHRTSSAYYGYLKGMYAFGLEETGYYDQAEKSAFQALDVNKRDGWASHAIAHVYEMEGKHKTGEKFLSSTKDDWIVCGGLSGHIHWHWCLMLMEDGRYDDVLNLYDSFLHEKLRSTKTMLDTVDTTSLLYRLQLEGVNVGDRWEDVYEICRPHLDDHRTMFNDAHLLMSLCGMNKPNVAEEHLASLIDYANTEQNDNASVCRTLGIDLYKAIKAYNWGDYGEAVELLAPIRYDIVHIGGSAAQRDIFDQILIHSALKSPLPQHSKLAKALVYERKALKENSPLTDRLLAKVIAKHASSDNHH